jgi:DNA-binding MarR family transcriptional regulator
MNKKLKSTKILFFAKKIKAIELLGGKCEICGDKNIHHLVFHHNDSELKEININKLRNLSFSNKKKEIDKCKLLCANCHNEFHNNINDSIYCITEQRRFNKKLFIDYKGSICNRCGYSKNQTSLAFHHMDSTKKLFEFSGFRGKLTTIKELDDFLTIELDKCELICQNCHTEEHVDIDFFNLYYNEIIEKSKNYKEKQSKLPIDEVILMYKNGKKQIEIAKIFNASKGTISGIIKNSNIEKINIKVDIELIKKLYFNDKLKQIDIARKLNISKGTVSGIIKKIKYKSS